MNYVIAILNIEFVLLLNAFSYHQHILSLARCQIVDHDVLRPLFVNYYDFLYMRISLFNDLFEFIVVIINYEAKCFLILKAPL